MVVLQVNPHKWKKYSLEDADISDRSNTSAAFAFLKEIENRKEREGLSDDAEGSSSTASKIVFNRSRNNPKFQRSVHLQKVVETPEEDESTKATFKSSKVVMPEYNFGLSKKTKKSISKPTKEDSSDRKRGKALQLDHLMADDEEDDE